MSLDPWLSGAPATGGGTEHDAAQRAREAAATLGNDYVSQELAEARRQGQQAAIDASARLQLQAVQVQRQQWMSSQGIGASAGLTSPTSPSTQQPNLSEPFAGEIDLSGLWESADYECPWGCKRTETVSITHQGDEVIATKISGDDCVPAGFVTFAGTLPRGFGVGAIRWTTGVPDAPASSSIGGFLRIIDKGSFRAGAPDYPLMTFRRCDSAE